MEICRTYGTFLLGNKTRRRARALRWSMSPFQGFRRFLSGVEVLEEVRIVLITFSTRLGAATRAYSLKLSSEAQVLTHVDGAS